MPTPIHIVVDATPSHADPTAWVSAAAAVVQALGAIAAIIYSGKLARDAARREIAADEAAQRRIDQAAATQEALAVRLADEASERETAAELARRNRPIEMAVALAGLARDEIKETLEGMRSKLGTDEERYQRAVGVGRNQQFLLQRLPQLISDVADVDTATAMNRLIEVFGPISSSNYQPAADWVPILENYLVRASNAIDDLRSHVFWCD